MRYAIDRIKTGTEKEVRADEFSGLYYIPCAHSRFFCPECGEQVFWRASGGSHSCHFYHKARTATTPECDKRVDGRSELNIYERVGLPVYLSRSNANGFQLNIAFPAIGETALDTAANSKVKVTIACNNHSRDVFVNQTNFFADATTLIPVRFVPSGTKNYSIKYSGSFSSQHKWSDYADGFARGGGVFHYSEGGGKKIRRGDSISPGEQYYVITNNIDRSYSEIQYTQVGSILLNDRTYYVLTMTVNVSVNDESKYRMINQHVYWLYGVWLLETVPEVVPLWPPVIEQDTFIPTGVSNSIVCSVLSGNDAPNVYSYTGNFVSKLTVTTHRNTHSVSIPVFAHESIISVDRKYVGREVTFTQKQPARINSVYRFQLQSPAHEDYAHDALTKDLLAKDFLVKSNAKAELYVESVDHTYLHIPIRTEHACIPGRSNISRLLFTVEDVITHQLSTKASTSAPITAVIDDICITENAKGVLVPVPRWIAGLLANLCSAGQADTVMKITRTIVNGRIPIGLVHVLAHINNQFQECTKG